MLHEIGPQEGGQNRCKDDYSAEYHSENQKESKEKTKNDELKLKGVNDQSFLANSSPEVCIGADMYRMRKYTQ